MSASEDRLGRYRLTERLRGGTTEIWRAVDTRDERAVLVYVLPHLAQAAARERFERDRKVLEALGDPAIAAVGPLQEVDGKIFAVGDAVEGPTLDMDVPRGGLEPARLVADAEVLADALRAAHDAGVTHRELVPERVVASPDGPRILGFGLSATEEGGDDPDADPDDTPTLTLTREGSGHGLPYLSPEHVRGMPLDRGTDVYSLGAVLHWMATGTHPFHGDSLADLYVAVIRDPPRALDRMRRDVPPHLVPIVARCMAKSRDRRYPSGIELHAALVATT